MSQPTTKLEVFLSAYGKRGEKIIELLSKLTPFIKDATSPSGYELIKEDATRMAELLNKLCYTDEYLKEQEQIELKYLGKRMVDRYTKIKYFNEQSATIENHRIENDT